MKRLLAILGVAALVGFALAVLATQTPSPDGTVQDGVDSIPTPPDADAWTVVEIIDGDTLRLRDPVGAVESVRLIGIDTPEVYPQHECFGDEAEAELARLAPPGSTVQGAADADPFDRYDRMLLYLWNGDGVFVNMALVAGGYAQAIRVAPNDRWYDRLRATEDAAAQEGLGMWGGC